MGGKEFQSFLAGSIMKSSTTLQDQAWRFLFPSPCSLL